MPFRMRLPQLLPPNGYAYEIVAEFLMSEQRVLDEDQTDEESDVEGPDNDHEDDEDDKSSQSGHEDDEDDKSSQSDGPEVDEDGKNKRKADCLDDGDDDEDSEDDESERSGYDIEYELPRLNGANRMFGAMYADRNPRFFACDGCISAGKQDSCKHTPALEPPADPEMTA
eukprot:g5990.t1